MKLKRCLEAQITAKIATAPVFSDLARCDTSFLACIFQTANKVFFTAFGTFVFYQLFWLREKPQEVIFMKAEYSTQANHNIRPPNVYHFKIYFPSTRVDYEVV